MSQQALSIRPFIGAKDFELSRRFYRDLGFEEKLLFPNMCVFRYGGLSFYLQDAYVKDWIDNTMVFLEVEDVDHFWGEVSALGLPDRYPGVKLTPVRRFDWGRECYIHDPSGILWHIGQFHQ